MTRKVTGYKYLDRPEHNHDCGRCKFLFCVVFYNQDHIPFAWSDVYESCDNSFGETPYLIRHSDKDGDYTTCGLKQLIAGYVENRCGLIF